MSKDRSFIIEAGDQRIEALFELPPIPPKGAFVLCHPYPIYGGDMYNKVVKKMAEGVLENGFAALRYNMRGVGASTGSMAVPAQDRADLVHLLEWLGDQPCTGPVFLAGYSYGAFISISLLADPERGVADPALSKPGAPRVEGIISVACPINLPEFSFAALPPVPIEMIQGTSDELIPKSELEESLQKLGISPESRWREPRWIEGADHCFNGKLPLLRESFVEAVRNLSRTG